MTAQESKSSVKPKSILAIVGILALALVAKLLGIELPTSNETEGSGGGSGGAVATAPEQPSSTPKASAPKVSTAEPKASGSTNGGSTPVATPTDAALLEGVEDIVQAFKYAQSGIMITAMGEVVHILPDDNEGSRHQKFLVEVTDDLTLLFAHNIDLAPRVPVSKGDTIEFNGQYEYSDKGGTVHWTHHDPAGRHEDGWIRHEGRLYE